MQVPLFATRSNAGGSCDAQKQVTEANWSCRGLLFGEPWKTGRAVVDHEGNRGDRRRG